MSNGAARRGIHLASRSKARVQWLVLATALTVLAGVLVAWALSRAAARIEVVIAARPVAPGTEFVIDDLTTAPVAVDPAVTGLVPAASIDDLVGRVATIGVPAGSVVTAGMWTDGTELRAGEHAVGAVLRPGRLPERLGAGHTAMAVPLEGSLPVDGAVDGAVDGVFPVRVITARRLETGEASLVLAVAAAEAPQVARLAASDSLVLVGLPPAGASPTASTTGHDGAQGGGR